MKKVTVYTLEKKQVMVYDGQDAYEYFKLDRPEPIYDSDFEFIDKYQIEFEKIQLPIRLYRTIGEEDLYIAGGREVLKLLGLEENQVKEKLSRQSNTIEQLNSELERFRNMSTWETFKVAWGKLWEKS